MKSKNLLHDIGKNYEAGSYTPCFFITKISTHKIKYHDFDENEKATHLHEYIHFIQDISTYYGILSILTKLSNICLNFHDLSKNKTNIKKEFENNIEFTCCLEETLGEIPDNEDDISSYQINDIKYGENSYPSIDKKTVYYEIVLVDDQYEKEQRIKFGAIFILEGMAYIIEKCAYSSQNLPLLRYNIARNIVKYVLKNDISDSDFINICDASLQSQNPGLTFFNILNTIKNYPSIDDAINSFTLTEKKYPIWKAPNLLRSDNIFENILSNIGNSHYRQDIKTYIEKMIDSALIYRDKNPFLFKNLSIEIKNHTTSLREMYNNFGTPNIFNIDNVFLGSIPISTENHTGLTKMILICSFLEKINNKYRKTFKCPLYETCLRMNTCPNIFDEYICENDFRKLENTGEMCIAYALAQNMGLLNII